MPPPPPASPRNPLTPPPPPPPPRFSNEAFSPPSLLTLKLGSLSLALKPPDSSVSAIHSFVSTAFDGSMRPDIEFDALALVRMDMSAADISVKIRGQDLNLAQIQAFSAAGDVAAFLPATAARFYEPHVESLDNHEFELLLTPELPQLYMSMQAHASDIDIFFQPSSLYALQEVSSVAARLLPESFDSAERGWRWWDLIRR